MALRLHLPPESNSNPSLDDSIEFDSKEDAFKFYKDYAISVGFSAIIKTSRRSRISGKFIDAKFVCSRYGSKPCATLSDQDLESAADSSSNKKRGRTNRSWAKTDCKACMHVKRRQDGKWIISSLEREHNHGILPNQALLRNMQVLNDVQLRKNKICSPSTARESGQVGKTKTNENTGPSSSGLHLTFRDGDMQVLLEYFSHMQDQNPFFFYAMDLNQDQQLKNVFWVDAKSRIDYGNFGDVVFFDTAYKHNEFKMPFAPFVGMNNHFQFVLFGCALVSDESKFTYVWLLRAWIRSMHGRAPTVILTDQDQKLKEAIAEVLPTSRHCFCLWRVLTKVQEKLSHVIRKHENFLDKFHKCIFKSETEAQFKKRWWKLVERFDLSNDDWIQSLYDDRSRWVPTFMNDIFLAGLSSPEPLESITSLLDKFLLHKTSLKEFLHQYNSVLQERCEDEAKADFGAWHKQPGLKSPSPYGKQMATIYTNNVFKKFQVEVLGVVACHPKKESEDGSTKTFKVQDFEANQVYKVTWNEKTSDTFCTCHLFEYNGFLCRHAMIVLQISGVNHIPAKYILERWAKDAKNKGTIKQPGPIDSRNQRYSDLCLHACEIGDEVSLSRESHRIAFTTLEEALRRCERLNNAAQYILVPNSPSNNVNHDFEVVNRGSCMSGSDIISGKEKVDVETEERAIGMHCWDQLAYLNFRAPAADCSYGSQESRQGLEQLNLRVPTSGEMSGCERIFDRVVYKS